MNNKLCFVIVIFAGFAACKKGNNRQAIEAISQCLTSSNELITQDNDRIYADMNLKARMYATRAKALIWEPKMLYVKKAAADIRQYIDSLQQQPQTAKSQGNTLFERLTVYQQSMMDALDIREFEDNPFFKEQLLKDRKAIRKSVAALLEMPDDNTANFDKYNWINTYINGNSPQMVVTMLNKLQNDVTLSTHMFIEYCNIMVADNSWGMYFDRILATISSQYVKAGQPLEINAGIGFFSSNKTMPQIIINNVELETNYDGLAVYKLKAEGKPGTRQVPVKITYYNLDGTSNVFTQQLEYTIIP